MTLTLENIPLELDTTLRRLAAAQGKPLEQVAVDALKVGLPASDGPVKYRDLSDLVGKWIEDPAFDAAIQEQDQIDPEMWR